MAHGRSGCVLTHPKGTDGNARAPRYLERRTKAVVCQRLLSKGALKFFQCASIRGSALRGLLSPCLCLGSGDPGQSKLELLSIEGLCPIVPKGSLPERIYESVYYGLSLWGMGDRVWLETATPPVIGKETWAEVGLPRIASICLLSEAGGERGDGMHN